MKNKSLNHNQWNLPREDMVVKLDMLVKIGVQMVKVKLCLDTITTTDAEENIYEKMVRTTGGAYSFITELRERDTPRSKVKEYPGSINYSQKHHWHPRYDIHSCTIPAMVTTTVL